MQIEQTLHPTSQDITLLTENIGEEVEPLGLRNRAYPFAFFIKGNNQKVIGGCNGCVIYGSIYTDQLWVHRDYRKQGLGRQPMECVHDYGREVNCKIATVATMSFQGTQSFYEKLGYECDFKRPGYAKESECLFLRKEL